MKLLSIAVPCYNSEAYMERCIKSLLPGGERVEILLVNDGSKDRTAEIAESYAAKYPTIIRAIHQENKGHGGAVNTGIANASGKYFKVVDSDDKVAEGPYKEILDTLQEFEDRGDYLDLLVSNFIYDKQGASHKKVMRYAHFFPEKKVFDWKSASNLPMGKYLLMHSMIYRTELLHESGMVLPEHTFYVDNLFAYEPLPYVKKMYYLDVDFYLYYIGREDQSVNEQIMIKRIDQQLRVNKRMAEVYTKTEFTEEHLKKYMYSYLEIITTVSSIMLIRGGEREHLVKKRELLEFLKGLNEPLYRKYRRRLLGVLTNLPGSVGRKISSGIYRIVNKVYGFN